MRRFIHVRWNALQAAWRAYNDSLAQDEWLDQIEKEWNRRLDAGEEA